MVFFILPIIHIFILKNILMKIIITEEQFKKLVNLNEDKYIVYHSTNADFDKFDFKKGAMPIVWFTDSLDSITNKTTGAAGYKHILKREITLNNPAGWDEYEKLGIGQLKDRGYDGVILPFENETNYIVFYPKSIKKVKEKVTEAKVNGIILFHGSNHEINKFSDDFIGTEQAVDANGPGIYFSDNKEDSEHYGKIMYTVRFKQCNIITDKNKKQLTPTKLVQLIKLRKDWEMNAQDWDENPNKGLNVFINEIFSGNDNSKDILLDVWVSFYRYNSVEFARNCVKLGIDGINVTNQWGGGGSSEHYIIYNPNIIEVVNIEKQNGD